MRSFSSSTFSRLMKLHLNVSLKHTPSVLAFSSIILAEINSNHRLINSLGKNELDLLSQVCNFKLGPRECARVCVSNRIKKHSKKQFSTADAFVQLLRASWVIFIEDGVRKQPTRLPRKNLTHKRTHHYTSVCLTF